MTIQEKYLKLRKKSANRNNNRYLFTYLENRPKYYYTVRSDDVKVLK